MYYLRFETCLKALPHYFSHIHKQFRTNKKIGQFSTDTLFFFGIGWAQMFLKETFPAPAGMDFSGKVVEIGKDVSNFKVGELIFGALDVVTPGSFGELICIQSDKACVCSVPAQLNALEAAGLTLAGLTAYQCLKRRVQQGSVVVVRGASGSVGHLAVQLALALGASRVVAISSRVAFCTALGAHQVVDYKSQDWVAAVRGMNADIFVDCVGGEQSWPGGKQCLKPSGVFIPVALDRDAKPTIGSIISMIGTALWRKAWALVSSEPAYDMFVAANNTDDLRAICALISGGATLRPRLDPSSPLPFTEKAAIDMYQRQTDGDVQGKLIMQINEL
jgi:NADPH:quinone reductase-like Zn-dependent oxidoreductase